LGRGVEDIGSIRGGGDRNDSGDETKQGVKKRVRKRMPPLTTGCGQGGGSGPGEKGMLAGHQIRRSHK